MEKKILILALLGDPTLPAGVPNTGGFNQTLRELITSLAGFHLPICIVTDTTEYCADYYTRISSHIELYRVSVSLEEHKHQENLRFAQARILDSIHSILGKSLNDVALIHSFYWFSGHLAKCIHDQYHIPYIHTPISLAYHKLSTGCEANCQFQVECEPLFLRDADYVLAITEQEANILRNYYCVRDTHVIITGRSVDNVFHAPARDRNGCPRGVDHQFSQSRKEFDAPWWNFGAYTYLGRMVQIKGVIQIVQAWISLRKLYGETTPPLWLVGGTPTQISDFRQKILGCCEELERYEAQQEIVWWGYLDQASISTLFLKTLVLVTHSQFEPGGRVVLEAMCQGKPVIATPNGFAADFIHDRVNGFLVPYGDVRRLARCMEYFIRQPYLAQPMGKAAKLTFEKMELDWNYVGIHRDLYKHYLVGAAIELPNIRVNMPTATHELLTKVDGFPYFDVNLSAEDLVKELPYPTDYICPLALTDSHARHYKGYAKGLRFRVKQFYSQINENAIWNSREHNKVILGSKQLRNAEESQQCSCIASILYVSKRGNYYVLPELEPISPSCEDLNNLLVSYSTHKNLRQDTLIDRKPPVQPSDSYPSIQTLESKIELLSTCTKELGHGTSTKILHFLPRIEKLSKETSADARFGFNYGKDLVGHVFSQKGHLVLLPSADWYWGEIGTDFVNACIWSKTPVCALQGQIDKTRQLLWLVCIVWEKILQAEWNNVTVDPVWIQELSQALLSLEITNEAFIP